MELAGERLIPAPLDVTWAALNDPKILKACIAGCESLERTGVDSLVAVVALKVGPVSARFNGNLAMTNVRPPTNYTINFDGQGGVAGFGKGSADVALTSEGMQTRLAYGARATVGGKMAQIGSRLIDATAAKITEDFFKAFEAQLQARLTPAEVSNLGDGEAPAGDPTSATPAKRGYQRYVWWLVGALVAALAIYLLRR
jgi:carbon monoxide dehydrogenase subunit G